MNYDDYVCGTKFRDMADVVIGQHGKIDWQPKDVSFPPEKLVVYCHTHDFRYLIDRIKEFHYNVVLVTHNSDGAVRISSEGQSLGENDADASLLPPNVIKWYAQNVDFKPELLGGKLVPIPIGLENSYCFPYDKARMLFDKNPLEWEPKRGRPIYFNCNLRTNPKERGEAMKYAYDSKMVTIKEGMNGQDYNAFLDDIINHKAVISPRGNGLDCHRTWEALYLQRVPIMLSIPSMQTFGLPILFLPNWSYLHYDHRKESLEDAIDDCITDIYDNRTLQALSMNYWIKRIRNAE